MGNKNVNHNTKKEFKQTIESYTNLLVSELLKEKIIEVSDNDKNAYQLVKNIAENVETQDLPRSYNKLLKSFNEFKNVITLIYKDIGNIEANENVNFNELKTDIFSNEKYFNQKIYGKKSIKFLKDIKNIDSEKDKDLIIKKIQENNIQFSPLISSFLEYYTWSQAKRELHSYNFTYSDEGNKIFNEVDIVGLNKDGPDVLMDIKFRKIVSNSLKRSLFQGYEYLRKYDDLTNKSNFLILQFYTNQNKDNFQELYERFMEYINNLFPKIKNRISLNLISIDSISDLKDSLKALPQMIKESQPNLYKYFDKPFRIKPNSTEKVETKFLNSKQGSLSAWVKIKPYEEYLSSPMNFQYIFAHATNDYKANENKYENAFSLSLAPDRTNNTKFKPTSVRFTFWMSNEVGDIFRLRSSDLKNQKEEWFHLLVRWNIKDEIIELLVNGRVEDSKGNYLKCWPGHFDQTAFLGTWGNKSTVHYIDQPLYRLLGTEEYLTNDWAKKEQAHNPYSTQ